ncbi:family 1 glycosylhydrolase [Candidatus Nanohaloarchaea archaeon]|nr:family 1 glycosylhydrolase [Candidatus Nanohaloarchaea archaeon]
MTNFREFPEDFFWGSATAAHQVEGDNTNDWTRWEKQNAEKLADNAKSRFNPYTDLGMPTPEWQEIKDQASRPENYISGKAADHLNRYKKDFQLASKLNHNAYRFSIEWSRIEPEEGEINPEAIEHYHQVLDELEKRGIEPFVTLHHFTNPQWFADRGGWASRQAHQRWQNFLDTVVEEFGDRVDYWITVNEPLLYSLEAYLLGGRPPNKHSPVAYRRSVKNLIKFHKQAYRKIKRQDGNSNVSFSTNNAYFESGGGPLNTAIAKIGKEWWNNYFIKKALPELDFIALNFYFRNRIHYGFFKNEYRKKSDMGWELYPQGIYNVLQDLKKYNLPIIITENGLADSEDSNRTWYLQKILKHIHRAREDNAPVAGYLHWSLLDNFEWDFGFWPRFGLIEVEYDTYERTVRGSAEKYAEIIDQNGLYSNE